MSFFKPLSVLFPDFLINIFMFTTHGQTVVAKDH